MILRPDELWPELTMQLSDDLHKVIRKFEPGISHKGKDFYTCILDAVVDVLNFVAKDSYAELYFDLTEDEAREVRNHIKRKILKIAESIE